MGWLWLWALLCVGLVGRWVAEARPQESDFYKCWGGGGSGMSACTDECGVKDCNSHQFDGPGSPFGSVTKCAPILLFSLLSSHQPQTQVLIY